MLRSSVYREDDYRMLQQKIIHLNSELSRYKAKVKEYQDDYHYSQLEQLKEENLRLRKELDESAESLEKERNAFARKLEEHTKNNLSSISDLEEYIMELEKESRESDRQIKELEETLIFRDEETDSLQAQLEKLRETAKHEQAELIDLRNELGESKKTLEINQSEHQIMLAEQNRLLEENSQLANQHQFTMNELLKLQMQLGAAKQDPIANSEASSPSFERLTEAPNNANRLKELQTQVYEYSASISLCLQQIAELEEQMDLLMALVTKLESGRAKSSQSFKHH